MKHIFAIALLFIIATPVMAADPIKPVVTPPATVTQDAAALATRLAAVMPLDQQVVEFTTKIAATLPEDKRAVFTGIMKKNVDITKLRAAAAEALQKTYSVAEMKTLIEFYSKPETKGIMAKMDDFGQALAPTVDAMVKKAVEDSQKAGVLPQS